MAWGYAKGFVIEHDPTVKKRIDCKSCEYYDSSDKSCLKRPLYLPVDGYNSWRTCKFFCLDKNTNNYDEKKAQYESNLKKKQQKNQSEQPHVKKKSAVHRQDNTSVKVEKKPNNSIQSVANNTKRDNLSVTLPRGYTVIVIKSKLSGTKKMRRQNIPIVTGTGKKKQVMITVDDTNHIVYVHGGVYTQEAIMKLREKLQ